jgi:hydrogenase maturation protease
MIGVIGIGQSLRGDDAAGLEAVRRWRAAFPDTACRPDVRVEVSELPGLGLLGLLDGLCGAVLVDAVRSDAAAGSVHELEADQLESFTPGDRSAHGWGVAETLKLRRALVPPAAALHLKLIGIEAADVTPGAGLSPAVERSLPSACQAIQQQVLRLLGTQS